MVCKSDLHPFCFLLGFKRFFLFAQTNFRFSCSRCPIMLAWSILPIFSSMPSVSVIASSFSCLWLAICLCVVTAFKSQSPRKHQPRTILPWGSIKSESIFILFDKLIFISRTLGFFIPQGYFSMLHKNVYLSLCVVWAVAGVCVCVSQCCASGCVCVGGGW